ncbi:MAG: hypothetical protein VX830_12065 [Candidatus Poribacteria bacterium]|nr:hypothetical protein [Candidatus Poribacteria bacterium]
MPFDLDVGLSCFYIVNYCNHWGFVHGLTIPNSTGNRQSLTPTLLGKGVLFQGRLSVSDNYLAITWPY